MVVVKISIEHQDFWYDSVVPSAGAEVCQYTLYILTLGFGLVSWSVQWDISKQDMVAV